VGDLAVSIVAAGRSPAYQLQDDPRLPSRASGDESGTKRWYRQAKETKCGETDGKESECPIVASKRGNGPYRTPWSQGGAVLWAQRRNHAEDIEPPSVSPQGHGTCEGQRHNMTSRMPLTGTSGSVGDLGGQPPRSTRPFRSPLPANPRVNGSCRLVLALLGVSPPSLDGTALGMSL
jgi:hypothetical protein